MPGTFHERFDIEIGIEEARRRFVNRANNIFSELLSDQISHDMLISFERTIVSALGETYDSRKSLSQYIGSDFYKALRALEGFYDAFSCPHFSPIDDVYASHLLFKDTLKAHLAERIVRLFMDSEVDLGIRWENGYFVKSGAKLLDQALVNDVLHWLRDKAYDDVLKPYEKGLRHFLEAEKRPEVLSDVITDTYEAVEALAKIVTRRPNTDLSSNAEAFIKAVKASDEYKNILKEYIAYANRFRHSPTPARSRPSLSVAEVESFIYLTGIFIRLAITVPGTEGVV